MSDAVIIVGAGPAGLMLAIELRLAGIETIVIERSPTPNEHTIGGTLHARSIELFDRRGFADTVRALNAPVFPQMHFAGFWLDMKPLLETNYSLLMPQQFTERILEERAVAMGAVIRRGRELVGLDQDERGVRAVVRTETGEEELNGAYLVGCDGTRSVVRALGGFPVRESRPSWYGLLADVVSIEGDWPPGFYPDGQFAVIPPPFPGSPSRLMTLEFDVTPPADDEPVTVEEVRASIKRITGRDATIGQTLWLHRYANLTREAETYRQGRIFLAGDAAHTYIAMSSHGLNTALYDAANLGWKLGADLNGWAPDDLLDTYDAERRPVGHRACAQTLGQMALQARGEKFDALRELFSDITGFAEVSRYLVTRLTDVHYEVGGTHPLVGWTVPAIEVKTHDGSVTAAEALREGRGILLDLTAESGDAVSGWSDRVRAVAGQPAESAVGLPANALLVRPDGVVVWAGDECDAADDDLRRALLRWFGRPRP